MSQFDDRAVARQISDIVARFERQDANALPTHPAAWFLGPNAENLKALQDMALQAITAHGDLRVAYQEKDPDFIPKSLRNKPAHKAALKQVAVALDEMMIELRNSIPLASYRNQSHMYWDISLPGTVGYLGGLLYNQNNVAPEASPVTTALEIVVGRQLCKMLGYDIHSDPAPWGHITCDGSVANIEAMWAARNLRLSGVAMAGAIEAAIAHGGPLADARDVTVLDRRGDRVRLLDLTRWAQVNLGNDQLLGLRARVAKVAGLPEAQVNAALSAQSVQTLGLLEFYHRHLEGRLRHAPVVLVPATAHYSWEKGATVLGLGSASLRSIAVDEDWRMSAPALRRTLDDCLNTQTPVAQVVAVMGSTEQSAVDPLAEILEIRNEYAQMGLEFSLHADAAWGGYFASMLRVPADGFSAPQDGMQGAYDAAPERAMSPYVARQFAQLGQTDSITVDPHKAGFMAYPAGALCYRDARMPQQVRISAAVIDHDASVPTVGTFGIEGSKPGAAAVGVALGHRVIPPDQTGFGRLLARCTFNAKRYYAAVVTIAGPRDPFTVTPLQRLPAEVDNATSAQIAAQRKLIAEQIVPGENDALMKRLKDDALEALFARLGPDLTVFAYAFNLRLKGGVNRDPQVMNAYNDRMYQLMSLQRDEHRDKPQRDIFVTGSAIAPEVYGADFVRTFAARAGLHMADAQPVHFLISTMQNPWFTATAGGDMTPVLVQALRAVAVQAARETAEKFGLTLAC